MKRLFIFIICITTLFGCEGDELLDDAVRLINDVHERNEPHDTFLRVENNSNFTMDNFEIGFKNNNEVSLNSLLPDKIYGYTGFHQISNLPFIQFTVNQDVYVRELINTTDYITSGKFVIKVDIISVNNQTFSFKIVQE